MPFGFTNAPTTLKKMMDQTFRPHGALVGVFSNDMIIFSKFEETPTQPFGSKREEERIAHG